MFRAKEIKDISAKQEWDQDMFEKYGIHTAKYHLNFQLSDNLPSLKSIDKEISSIKRRSITSYVIGSSIIIATIVAPLSFTAPLGLIMGGAIMLHGLKANGGTTYLKDLKHTKSNILKTRERLESSLVNDNNLKPINSPTQRNKSILA